MNILSTIKTVTQDVSTDIGEFRITRRNDGIAFVEHLDPASGRYFYLGDKQKVSTDDHNQLVRMAWEL